MNRRKFMIALSGATVAALKADYASPDLMPRLMIEDKAGRQRRAAVSPERLANVLAYNLGAIHRAFGIQPQPGPGPGALLDDGVRLNVSVELAGIARALTTPETTGDLIVRPIAQALHRQISEKIPDNLGWRRPVYSELAIPPGAVWAATGESGKSGDTAGVRVRVMRDYETVEDLEILRVDTLVHPYFG